MRKSISTAFFSMVSTLMVLGIVLMGCSEWVLFKNYFAKDRYETLDQVVNVAKRTAEYLVNSETMPQGAELDALNTKLEIIGESAEACSLPPTRKSLPPTPCRWISASAPTQWLTRTPGTTTLSAIWAVP